MANCMVYLDALDKKLHEKNKFTDYLEKAEKATGVRRLYMVLGAGCIWALYMIFGCAAELICNSIGFGYPAYASSFIQESILSKSGQCTNPSRRIGAIESRNKDDDTKWLTYWVVFASFSLAEFFSDFILSWLPFYWLMKCIFLVWCFLPISCNGAQMIYHKFIRPVFLKNRQAIDNTIDKAMSGAAGMVFDSRKSD